MRISGYRYERKGFFLAALILGVMVASPTPTRSQDQNPSPNVTIKHVPVQQTNEISGSKLFHSYCAVCHGVDGKGSGPAAPGLKTAPADLTSLAKNNGGKFPAEHVLDVLSSNADFTSHGSKDMPIWGPVFRSMGANQSLGTLRARNVTEYLRSIQAK